MRFEFPRSGDLVFEEGQVFVQWLPLRRSFRPAFGGQISLTPPEEFCHLVFREPPLDAPVHSEIVAFWRYHLERRDGLGRRETLLPGI
jgi:hypothetical protein